MSYYQVPLWINNIIILLLSYNNDNSNDNSNDNNNDNNNNDNNDNISLSYYNIIIIT